MPDMTRSLLDVLKRYQQNSLGYKMDFISRSLATINVRTGIYTRDVSNESYDNLINCYKLFAYAEVERQLPADLPKDDLFSALEEQLTHIFGFKIVKSADNSIRFLQFGTEHELTPIYLTDKYKFTLINKESGEILMSATGEPLELNLLQLLVNSNLNFSDLKATLTQQLICGRSTKNIEANAELMNGIAWNTWQYENACKELCELGKQIYSDLKAKSYQQHNDFERTAELSDARTWLQAIEIDDLEIKQNIKNLFDEINALESSATSKQQLAKTLYYVTAYLKKELTYDDVKAKLKANDTATLEALRVINAYQLKYGRVQYALNKLAEKKENCTDDELNQLIDKLISEIRFLTKANVENQNQLRVMAYSTLFLLNNELSVEEYRNTAKKFITDGKPSNPWRAVGVLMLAISVAAIAAGIVAASMSALPVGLGAALVGGIILLSNRERGLYKIAKNIAETDEEHLQLKL